jgi:hypothetical protein
MNRFQLPKDLTYNRGAIHDPTAYAKETGCASWLFLVGEEFASMPGGMSWDQVQQSVPSCSRVISDPPVELDLDLARQHVAALEQLPRPTLISCRTGPRASAVAYMYAGLKSGATPAEVVAAAEVDGAPFRAFPAYKEWLRSSKESLQATVTPESER